MLYERYSRRARRACPTALWPVVRRQLTQLTAFPPQNPAACPSFLTSDDAAHPRGSRTTIWQPPKAGE